MKSQQYPMKSPSCTIYMGCNEISHHINSTKPLFFSFVSYDLLYPSYMPLYIIPVGTYWYGMWNIMGSHIANSVIIYHPSYTHYIYISHYEPGLPGEELGARPWRPRDGTELRVARSERV